MRLFSFPKQKKYYVKLLLYTAIIASIPILILSCFFYFGVKQNIKTQLNDATLSYLNQCENVIEVVLKQVDQSINQLIIDSSFKEFENFYNGDYYENIRGRFKDEDLPILYKYIDSKAEISEKLSVYKASNNFVDSVYFYDSSKKIVLTNKKFQYNFDKFYDKEWLKGIEDESTFPVILDTRPARQYDNTYRNIISIVYKTINSTNNNNYIVVNIDAEYLSDNLAENVENKLGRKFFIISENNEVIVKDRNDDIYKEIIAGRQLGNYSGNDSGIFEQKINGKKYVVDFMKNDAFNWTFITTISHNEFYSSVNYIRNLIVAIMIILIFLMAIVVIVSSKSIYKPISNIVTFLKKNIRNDDKDDGNEAFTGEIDYINNGIRTVLDNYTKMHNKLEKNLPDYKQSFMKSLLQYNDYKHEEIIEKMDFLGIDLDTKELGLMVVNIEEINSLSVDLSELRDYIIKTKDMLESKVSSRFKGVVLYGTKNRFIIVVNCNKDRYADVFEFSENLKDELQKEMDVKISIGISRMCDDILNLSHAYNEASEALKYRGISDSNDVIFIDEVKLRNKQFIIYPKERVEVIDSYIRAGKKKEALESFNGMIVLLSSNNKNIYFSEIQQISIRFLSNIISTVNTLGLELKDIFYERNLYQELLEKDAFQEINAWLQNIISEITDYISNAVNEKKDKYLEQINVYLERNLAGDITLNGVAEHLKLNPSYVSRLFKENTGKNFMEYLIEYRIDKSKELLLNTDLKVQDIGTKMGYSNSYYFIKVFKQHTGITPGEYKKSHESV